MRAAGAAIGGVAAIAFLLVLGSNDPPDFALYLLIIVVCVAGAGLLALALAVLIQSLRARFAGATPRDGHRRRPPGK